MLDLEYLDIKRVVVHHIHPRDANKEYVEPVFGSELIALAPSALDMFGRRMALALGHHSHGVKVDFHDKGPGSFFHDAVDLMDGDDSVFLQTSKNVAQRLARAQLSRPMAPSKLLVVSGVTSKKAVPFCAVIKAELQDALAERIDGSKSVLDHLTNIFMAEGQRFYKIGYVQKDSTLGSKEQADHFSVHLFDHLLTQTESRHAAFYFCSDFLGADIAASDRRLTQEFFERTQRFINEQPISHIDKLEKIDALRSELRSNDATISVHGFASKHMTPEMKTQYVEYMEKSKFTMHSITKDTGYIKGKLRRRQKMVFSNDVIITAPPDKMSELVTVEKSEDGSTTLKIRGTIESRE